MVFEDRYIYVFTGAERNSVIEVLDITKEDVASHCEKLCIPKLEDLQSSVTMVLTEPETLLILGGDHI